MLIVSSYTGPLTHAVWSPDGKSIYICSETSLSRLDLATGRETELYQAKEEEEMGGLDVSPDGQWLAFYPTEDFLAVMPSAGGEPREVVHLDEEEWMGSVAFVRWTPDGEHLLLGKRKNELWKVNIETNAQQQIGPAIEGRLVGAAMHPDGRQISFTALQRGSQLWSWRTFCRIERRRLQ